MKIKLNRSHYLLAGRFDNWIRLLAENGFHIRTDRIPQAIFISLSSLLLSPFALAEALVFGRRIKETEVKNAPLFVIGHWRSGTTFLQNILSQDPQFGWFDPVHTTTFSNSLLLGWLLGPPQKKLLKDARPMDNMTYGLDSPMEEVFAQATISPNEVIQMLSFPRLYARYAATAFVTDLTPAQQRDWRRSYMYIIKKMTYVCGGKRLLLKSPDNTGRPRELLKMFPDARFINIYRDPYVTIMSTINMFRIEMELLKLNDPPGDNVDELIEDTIITIYERMYRGLFELQKELPEGVMAEVRYEDFTKDPAGHLRKVYDELGLSGFEEALPRFEKYLESTKSYQKNKFRLYERLRLKINARLGFYFEHYGYRMQIEEIGEKT